MVGGGPELLHSSLLILVLVLLLLLLLLAEVLVLPLLRPLWGPACCLRCLPCGRDRRRQHAGLYQTCGPEVGVWTWNGSHSDDLVLGGRSCVFGLELV